MSAKQQWGFVIGKFYPPHAGHLSLIDRALEECTRVTVMVCAKDDQKPDGRTRWRWLKQLRPRADVILTPDDLPDEPGPWAARVKSLGIEPDCVYTSEHYGEPFAALLQCRHTLVDLDRRNFPCSGTAVRLTPLEQWPWLSPVVRAWYLPRVVIVGAESTGKTTLARRLAATYGTSWVPEYGRSYWEGKLTNPDLYRWTEEEFDHIARMQDESEDALALTCGNPILFCDTNSWATSIWKERYMGRGLRCAHGIADRLPANYALYLVPTPHDCEFVQDGTRDGEAIRCDMHDWFITRLKAQRLPYVELSGSWDERFHAALDEIGERWPRTRVLQPGSAPGRLKI